MHDTRVSLSSVFLKAQFPISRCPVNTDAAVSELFLAKLHYPHRYPVNYCTRTKNTSLSYEWSEIRPVFPLQTQW